MARSAATDAAVHRVLGRTLLGGSQQGTDVEALQSATRRRLGARGYTKLPVVDGELGPETTAAVADALYALGATLTTVKRARAGTISIGAQRMVRYPGNRTGAQLQRARERRTEVRRRARQANAGGSAPPSGSVADARRRAAEAARFALAHSGRHYTMGPQRWDPIRSGASPVGGRMWAYGDCSAVATWVLWHALGRGGPDVVNGQGWAAGYTGTMLEHGVRVDDGRYQPGDCAFYGNGWPGKHVTVYVGDGVWLSHGSEGGPYAVGLHYRGDLMQVRRYLR